MAAPAVLATLEAAWNALSPLNLPLAVGGGLALSFWKYPRATRDVDLVLGAPLAQEVEVVEKLQSAGFRSKSAPTVRQLGKIRIGQFTFQPQGQFLEIPLDLLIVDTGYHAESLARRVPAELPAMGCRLEVLSCEDLILYKLLAGRMIDRSDAAALLRANVTTVDRDYLICMAIRNDIFTDLAEVWREAFDFELRP